MDLAAAAPTPSSPPTPPEAAAAVRHPRLDEDNDSPVREDDGGPDKTILDGLKSSGTGQDEDGVRSLLKFSIQNILQVSLFAMIYWGSEQVLKKTSIMYFVFLSF